ncbi:MAG: 16S rRNA processing protein RimM [Nitrospirae bacterium]|nr:16S rRNA processing protein RimM [Nitrospirota bacterium]
MADSVELVAIGVIEKSFGVRGELRVRSLSDVPGRFEGLTRVTLEAPSGTVKNATIRSVRAMNGSYVLGMDVCSTPEDAAMFRGWTLKIPQGSAPPLPEGQYYEYELIGLAVQDETGRSLGTVEDILKTPGHHVFVVRGEDGEVLIPAAKDAVAAVDVLNKTMTVRRTDEVTAKETTRAAL